jgi:hypothetical protein
LGILEEEERTPAQNVALPTRDGDGGARAVESRSESRLSTPEDVLQPSRNMDRSDRRGTYYRRIRGAQMEKTAYV